jgi:hypothetical protein
MSSCRQQRRKASTLFMIKAEQPKARLSVSSICPAEKSEPHRSRYLHHLPDTPNANGSLDIRCISIYSHQEDSFLVFIPLTPGVRCLFRCHARSLSVHLMARIKSTRTSRPMLPSEISKNGSSSQTVFQSRIRNSYSAQRSWRVSLYLGLLCCSFEENGH